MDFDVVVVGGGMAGVVVASELSILGYKVLVVEKKNGIEEPVICSEYLPDLVEIEKVFPPYGRNLLKEVYKLFTADKIKNRLHNMVVEVEGLIKTISFSGFVIDRKKLASELITRAQENGAQVFTNTSFIDGYSEGEEIICRLKKGDGEAVVSCRFLVGADGYPSRVAASFGLGKHLSEEDVAYILTQQVSGLSWPRDSYYSCYAREISPGGYAWIIPHRQGIYSVGLGVEGLFKKELLSYYERFWRMSYLSGGQKEGRLLSKILPVGGLFDELARGRVVLVGDASGAVMPINGGGIPTAMMGGLILARAVEQFGLTMKAVLEYQRLIKLSLTPVLRFGLELRRATRKVVNRKPFHWLYSLLPEKLIIQILAGKKTIPTLLIRWGRFLP